MTVGSNVTKPWKSKRTDLYHNL